MAPRNKATTTKPANGSRATLRDLMSAVQGLNERIDGTNERADQTLGLQQQLSKQMTGLHESMHDLREATNERLHGMEADIVALKRPWTLLASGWSKAIALGTFGAALSGTIVRLELWRFFPGL